MDSTESVGLPQDVRVIADKDNNALLILANPADYESIESAIRKLDVAVRQVLVEVTIAEISFKDELKYGLEWYFKNGARINGKLDTRRVRNCCAGARFFLFLGERGGRYRCRPQCPRHRFQAKNHFLAAYHRGRQPDGQDSGGRPDSHNQSDPVRAGDHTSVSSTRCNTLKRVSCSQ